MDRACKIACFSEKLIIVTHKSFSGKNFCGFLYPYQESPRRTFLGQDIINKKIREAMDALLATDLDGAKAIYFEIIKMYNVLPNEKKSRIYQAIKELYDERKSAERIMMNRGLPF